MVRGLVGGRPRAVAALTTVLLLTGCTAGSEEQAGDDAPSAPAVSSPAATPSETAPSTAPVVPEAPESPAWRRGAEGRRAFARYVMEAWGWSLRSNDAAPLLRASPRKSPCEGCGTLADELARRAKQGWYVDFPGVEVERVRLRGSGDTVVATSRVDIPESDSFHEDGSFRSTNPAHQGATFTVRMRAVERGYRLLSFSIR
jgi:hypothetical protein